MTEREERLLEKWKRRAEIFRQAYREAEEETVNLKLEFALKIQALQQRLAEIEEKLK
jgi:hypothetical protein